MMNIKDYTVLSFIRLKCKLGFSKFRKWVEFMCSMNCVLCGFCTMKYKITHGSVSHEKLRYCNYYNMWVHEVVRSYKIGILS
jgi:hypothetical protein